MTVNEPLMIGNVQMGGRISLGARVKEKLHMDVGSTYQLYEDPKTGKIILDRILAPGENGEATA